ncbi:MAG: hypothetical protein GYA36_19835 [Veillonellaceae bacterium]|nr:hypothetical protein [Veillonellaceae bacterium]
MIIKEARALFSESRITVLGPRGGGLSKLASVLPAVEAYMSRVPRDDDGAHWIHLIALTASEYYGQNRNGDHWSLEALGHLPEGWSGNPETDRMLARTCLYGTGTYYNARVYPHHQNQDPNLAIGSVELVVWNPQQYWVELIIRLDKTKTFNSRVKWVLDRIAKGQPFDVSMGAKVPFDMATIGDMKSYREAQRSFDPRRHESPAAAVLEYHRRKKSGDGVGIYGLSITRNDYIPECKTDMGKLLEDGRQIGVRNDYPRFFDISVVYIGADKVAKFISKVASPILTDSLNLRRGRFTAVAADRADRMLKMAAKTAATSKEADIIKDVEPAFDDKSVIVLSASEPDLGSDAIDRLKEHPDLGKVLSTLASMGIILKPGEFQMVVGDRDVPRMHADEFDPSLASRMLGIMRHRSALLPSISNRLGKVIRYEKSNVIGEPGDKYRGYRKQVLEVLNGGPDRVFERNPDLWVTMLGRRGRVPLIGRLTKRYAELAYLPPTREVLDSAKGRQA